MSDNFWEKDPVTRPMQRGLKVNESAPWESDPVAGEKSAVNPTGSWWDVFKAIPGTVTGSVTKGVGGVVQAAAETPPQAPYGAPLTALERGDDPLTFWTKDPVVSAEVRKELPETPVAKAGAAVAEKGKEITEAAQPQNLGYWKRATLGGISSAAELAPFVVASVATKSPGPAMGAAGALTFGRTYAESREAGLDPERSGGHAAIDAGAEVLMEAIPMKFLVDNVGKKTIGTLIKGMMLREVPTELMTTAIQSANAKISTRPDMTWEDYGQDLLDTIGSTMISAPVTSGVAKGAHALFPGRNDPVAAPAPAEKAEVPTIEIPGLDGRVEPVGAINEQLIDPTNVEPTIIPDSVIKEQLRTEFHALDPDTIDEKSLTEARQILEAHEKAKERPALPDAELQWSALSAAPQGALDIGELSASAKQTANAANYVNPNVGERLDRVFSFSTDSEAMGQTPRTVVPKPGSYVLGQPSIDRPEAMLKPMMETVEQWRSKWMPRSTIILSNEQLLTNSALGWHYSMGDGKHLIVPAVLRKLTDPSKFNVNTLAGAFYNLSHEFGHALVKERFYEGAQLDASVRVSNESKLGVVSPESLALLPEIERKVVEEFNAVKARIIDGSMKAEELVRVWFGPAKLARDFLGDLKVAPSAPAMDVARAIASRAAIASTIENEISAEEFRKKMLEDVFSLDEYLAEQMSRYAYQRKMDQDSPFGQFLQKAMDSLRRFFASIKGEGIVAPGVSFAEWLDGLPQVSRLANEKQRVSESKQKAGKKKAKDAVTAPKKAPKKAVTESKPVKRVKKVEHQVRADTKLSYKQKATGMINLLVRDGTLDKGSYLHEEALKLVENDDRDEFADLIREVTGKTVKFEIDGQDDKKVSQIPEWRVEKFRSSEFRSWFGEWETDPSSASVVRVGAFEELQDGSLVVRAPESSPPLTLFMSRERLEKSDIYYASTLRGAQYAESMLSKPYGGIPKGDMVPVVLNIRNPYLVSGPDRQIPLPAQLESQGHDGIVYRNNFDGDLTFITFRPDQVKIVDDRAAYSNIAGVSMELDIDQSTPVGKGAAKLLQGTSNFLSNRGPLRRALRRLVHHPTKVFQIQQLAHIYPDLEDLAFFNHTNTDYVRYGASRRAVPDRLLQNWERMGKRNVERVNAILLKEMEEGKHWFELAKSVKTREGVQTPWFEFRMTDLAKGKLKENGVDIDTEVGERTAKHILEVKNSLLDSLNEDEAILFELLAHRYANSPPAMRAAWREVRAKVHELRKTPYFPQGRFGNLVLTIEKKKATGPGYEVIWREAFESEAEWEKAYEKALASKQGDERVRKHPLTDKEYVLMSLPTDFLDTVAVELGLSAKQIETLTEIARPVKSERLLKPYDLAKRGIKGYSSNAMRSYADFTWHHSNAQAKLLHGAKFNIAISGMRQRKNAIERSEQSDFPELGRLTQVLSAMEAAKDYIMSPPNEMQTARGIVSLVYLGLNVKTALINFYGLVTLWSDQIGKHGAIEGQKRMNEGIRLAALSMKLTDLNDRRKGNYLPPDIQKGLDRAIEEGILSQSYAYHLAGAANASNLARMPGYQQLGRVTQRGVDLAMWMFRMTDLASRRAAFVVALKEQLEKDPGAFDQAYREAVTQVNILQNDYSAGNRVPFMRGGKGIRAIVPLATIFMSFAQHMAFHGYGGYELGVRRKHAMLLGEKFAAGEITAEEMAREAPKWFEWGYGYTARIWLLTLLLAGYEGLPGAENILDLIEVIWRKIGKKPFRQELRELVQTVTDNPTLFSRGLGHDVAGFDISRSVGFGRFVPGTDILSRGKDASPDELAGALAFNLMGPTGNLLKFGMSAFGDDKTWGEKMQKLPGGVGNIWNAYYWSEHGVLGPNEGRITLEKGADGQLRPRDLTATELAGKALGFNPTIISQNREILWNQYDLKMYWQGRRQGLKRQYWDATREKDTEALRDVKRAISEFNLDMGDDPQYKKMRISPQELADSVRTHRRLQRLEERGLPNDKRSRGIYEDVRESY